MSHTFESVISQLKGKSGAEHIIQALEERQAAMPENATSEEISIAIREVLSKFIKPQTAPVAPVTTEVATAAPATPVASEPVAPPVAPVVPAPIAETKPAAQTVDTGNLYRDGIETVRGVFDTKNWKYTEKELREGICLFELSFKMENCSIRMKVYVETDPDVCRIDAILPITADSTYVYPLCKLLVKENYSLRYGAFQYNESNGEITFSYSFSTIAGLSADVFTKMFLIIANTADDSYPQIKKHCVGKFSSKETDEILNIVDKLMKDISED